MRALWALPFLALAACASEPENPFERELGPPPQETVTNRNVFVEVGTNGVDVGGSISRTRGNLTYGIGF
ncbi:hypothetical protein SAMN05421853_101356 [Roseivivax halotolerans]|uniref:Uncharacterized protein n=1 Tax=Roseivivax halotolerans TaxID=93684 RepID=A0A1I5V6A1_9RHOB|nr:hypothetical protein [Roseivivax halotolerans]SFQ03018.1 hypothetical protein SAMN05421853_101356 [Roseivivax halotolerans]